MVHVFSNQNSQFGKILEGIAMEDVHIFYDHLINFTAIWYILWPVGICSCWPFGIFSRFGIL
jgi:hypothetical protein